MTVRATSSAADVEFSPGTTNSFGITISVVLGTGVGLLVKYVLDKRYIFQFKARNISSGNILITRCFHFFLRRQVTAYSR